MKMDHVRGPHMITRGGEMGGWGDGGRDGEERWVGYFAFFAWNMFSRQD